MKAYLALVALLFATPAAAQSSVCTPLDIFVEQMTDRGATVRPIRGPAANAAVALYNNTPPVSNQTFDMVLVVERPDGAAAFWFGNDGMACVFLFVEAPTWKKIRDRFVGRTA